VESGRVSFKARLIAGEPLLGTFIKTPHPHVVEVLAGTGLDCLCLDAEHAPFDRGDLDLCIMAARNTRSGAGGMPILVRPASGASDQILNALDCGADGVVVPHVRSAKDAAEVASLAHYGAAGAHAKRGYAGSSRAAGYGTIGIADHLANSRARTTVIAQIEDVEALDEIDAIAAVDGIDALFIGRIDLTIALGCTSPDDPKVIAACDHIIAAAVRANRPVGLFTSKPSDAAYWQAKGARLFLLGSDHGFLRAGAQGLRDEAAL
jgi:staphyloferrin B biosynthesis citrate synthase